MRIGALQRCDDLPATYYKSIATCDAHYRDIVVPGLSLLVTWYCGILITSRARSDLNVCCVVLVYVSGVRLGGLWFLGHMGFSGRHDRGVCLHDFYKHKSLKPLDNSSSGEYNRTNKSKGDKNNEA